MELTDKTSNLLLFAALMMTRNGKVALADAIGAVPTSMRTRKLAELFARKEPFKRSGENPGGLPEDAARGTAQLVPAVPVESRPDGPPMESALASQHISRPAVAEMHVEEVRLRCPNCGEETLFELESQDAEHLHIRGHLERHCRYCGTDALLVAAQAKLTHSPALVI